MSRNICVFASSCNYLDESYYPVAAKLGELLAKSGFNMVYGGSSLGLMWACAEQVKKYGGKIYGVMPEKLYNMGVSTDECVDLTVTPCMRTRKAKMDELSDGVVALPGGFGTLEELSEMIVQKQLGYNNKPVIILNTNGFYNKLIEFFDVIIKEKFANHKLCENLYYVAQTPEEAVEYLVKYDYTAKSEVSSSSIYTR
ncbi:TIGR00730 family Rossman fold protein [Spirochaetes bacterium]|uniref:Cytokinin riboside 5'-monophosphate phosphoribohydrolase n=1 Tax=Candidatus Scatousia excrementipullorum TaxID=2840936 RepID=A0A9D9DP36_9BACT|nr:TIGR00730 family Rossman fold protein [Candidatus Scatousia excrementipullorum]